MIELILIVLIWLILPAFLILIFTWISRIGIYHQLKSTNNPDGEPFHTKFRFVFEFNLYLSLVIAAAMYITIKNSIQPSPSPWDISKLTFIISLVILLIQRILANPPSIIVNYINHHCSNIDKDVLIKRYRDFILSFFYAFFCAAIIIVLLIVSYNILINEELGLSTQNLTYREFMIASFLYIISLLSITFVGECILYLAQPDTMDD